MTLTGGDAIEEIVRRGPRQMPVLAIDAATGDTMTQVATDVTRVRLDGVGHLVAVEAPDALAATLLDSYRPLDRSPAGTP